MLLVNFGLCSGFWGGVLCQSLLEACVCSETYNVGFGASDRMGRVVVWVLVSFFWSCFSWSWFMSVLGSSLSVLLWTPPVWLIPVLGVVRKVVRDKLWWLSVTYEPEVQGRWGLGGVFFPLQDHEFVSGSLAFVIHYSLMSGCMVLGVLPMYWPGDVEWRGPISGPSGWMGPGGYTWYQPGQFWIDDKGGGDHSSVSGLGSVVDSDGDGGSSSGSSSSASNVSNNSVKSMSVLFD